jgi:asparagine synthase (glutamine-hydrolysing)
LIADKLLPNIPAGRFDIDGVLYFEPLSKNRERMLDRCGFRPWVDGIHLRGIENRSGDENAVAAIDDRLCVIADGEFGRRVKKAVESCAANSFSPEAGSAPPTSTLPRFLKQADGLSGCRGRGLALIFERNNNRSVNRHCLMTTDHLGSRPIYWFAHDHMLYWSTRLPALLSLKSRMGLPISVDPDALPDYLTYLHTCGPQTLAAGVYRLPAASTLLAGRDQTEVKRYWQPVFTPIFTNWREAAHAVRSEFSSAVAGSLRAMDSAGGLLLSGGLDSSLILGALCSRGRKPITYTVAWGEEGDEHSEAAKVARHFGTAHRSISVSPQEIQALLWQVTETTGFPSGNPSTLAVWAVARRCAQEASRIYSGLGSDEIFGGHRKHLFAAYRAVAYPLIRLLRHFRRLNWTVRPVFANKPDAPIHYREFYAFFTAQRIDQQLRPAKVPARKFAAPVNYDQECPAAEVFMTDVFQWLADGLLPPTQTLVASAGLELELPFCSDRLVELGARIPLRMKVKGINGKWILRRSAQDLLPKSMEPNKRRGFSLPIDRWLRGPLRHLLDRYLCEDAVVARGLFDPAFVGSLVNNFLRHRADLSLPIWAMLSLEVWQQIFVDCNRGVDGSVSAF